MSNVPKRRMSKQDREKWNELYEYVRVKVLGYDENQALSKNMILRLRGMLNGKFMANNSVKDNANYSYDVVLNTFKYSMPDIQRALGTVSFTDTNHKFNYIMRIVDGNLNIVYERMKKKKKVEEEISKEVSRIDTYKAVEYKPIKKTIKEDKFSNLW